MPYHPNLLLSVLNYVSIVILFVETPLDQSFYSQPSGDGTDEYDYIIVGAGSAGCVLANRLSKDPNMRVLLLEAGGPEEAAAQVPFFTTLLQFTRMDWGYHSEPQKNASYALFQRSAEAADAAFSVGHANTSERVCAILAWVTTILIVIEVTSITITA